MVVDDTLDLALTLKVADGHTRERAVDLETVNEDAGRDHLERRHLLHHTLVEDLVKVDVVLRLQQSASFVS